MHQAVLHLLSSLRSSSCVGYSEVNRFGGDEQSLASPLWKMMKIWNDACQAGMDSVSPRIRLSLHVLGSEIWTWSHSQFLQFEIKTVWTVWDSRHISMHLFENGLSTVLMHSIFAPLAIFLHAWSLPLSSVAAPAGTKMEKQKPNTWPFIVNWIEVYHDLIDLYTDLL